MPSNVRDNPYLIAQHARDALEQRLQQLEHEHRQFQATLRDVEASVRWLPDDQRVHIRRRLRRLGLEQQLGPFEGLRAVLDDAA